MVGMLGSDLERRKEEKQRKMDARKDRGEKRRTEEKQGKIEGRKG